MPWLDNLLFYLLFMSKQIYKTKVYRAIFIFDNKTHNGGIMSQVLVLFFIIVSFTIQTSYGQSNNLKNLNSFKKTKKKSISPESFTGDFDPLKNTVIDNMQFNGYTNHWHDTYRQ